MKRFKIIILLFSLFATYSFAQDIQVSSMNQNIEYNKRNIIQPYGIVFESMKSYLMLSKFLIKNGDKNSKFLYAEGMIVKGNNHYDIKLSVDFQSKFINNLDVTTVIVVANYKLIQESDKIETLKLGMVTLPISTPWRKEFRLKASDNIKDPKFFDAFYYGFYKTLYQEEISNYDAVKIVKKDTKENLIKDVLKAMKSQAAKKAKLEKKKSQEKVKTKKIKIVKKAKLENKEIKKADSPKKEIKKEDKKNKDEGIF